jgi:hypothetical protein
MKRPSAFGFLARLPHQLVVVFGLAVLVGTLGLTVVVPDKNLAVAIAVAGTFAGTLLVSLYLPKVVGAGKELAMERELSRSERDRRLKEAEMRLETAEQRRIGAEREIARLEAMRINVDAVNPILNLGLLDVETSITDFQHRILSRSERTSWWRSDARAAYTGVVRIPVKARLGVDLKVARLVDDGHRLLVSGLAMTTSIDTGEGATWLLDEVRTEYVRNGQVVRFKGSPHEQPAKMFSREQERQVRARLNQGQDFKTFEAGLIRTAQQVVRLLLAPMQKEVAFVEELPGDARALVPFLVEHNDRVKRLIEAAKAGNIETNP